MAQEWIDVVAIGAVNNDDPAEHEALVYHKADGSVEVLQAGPQWDSNAGDFLLKSTDTPLSNLSQWTEAVGSDPVHIDAYKTVFLGSDGSLAATWGAMQTTATNLDGAAIPYYVLDDSGGHNSNAFAATLLASVGANPSGLIDAAEAGNPAIVGAPGDGDVIGGGQYSGVDANGNERVVVTGNAPSLLDDIWSGITNFTTNTLPDFGTSLVDLVVTGISDLVQGASDFISEVGQGISNFFSWVFGGGGGGGSGGGDGGGGGGGGTTPWWMLPGAS